MTRRLLLLMVMLAGATPASAQSVTMSWSGCTSASFSQPFVNTLHDLRQRPSRSTVGILTMGGAAALAASAIDNQVTDAFDRQSLRSSFEPGAVIGGMPLQFGAALATFAIGRALNSPCAAGLGADLMRSQLMANALTIGIKQATRRSRPDGSKFSFPSGHTSTAFASATVLQRRFGWKAGMPAYAVATYVAASRIQMRRHHLSDVAFGAAIGILAGRTVNVGGGQRLMVTPIEVADGAGAGFTWVGTR